MKILIIKFFFVFFNMWNKGRDTYERCNYIVKLGKFKFIKTVKTLTKFQNVFIGYNPWILVIFPSSPSFNNKTHSPLIHTEHSNTILHCNVWASQKVIIFLIIAYVMYINLRTYLALSLFWYLISGLKWLVIYIYIYIPSDSKDWFNLRHYSESGE